MTSNGPYPESKANRWILGFILLFPGVGLLCLVLWDDNPWFREMRQRHIDAMNKKAEEAEMKTLEEKPSNTSIEPPPSETL